MIYLIIAFFISTVTLILYMLIERILKEKGLEEHESAIFLTFASFFVTPFTIFLYLIALPSYHPDDVIEADLIEKTEAPEILHPMYNGVEKILAPDDMLPSEFKKSLTELISADVFPAREIDVKLIAETCSISTSTVKRWLAGTSVPYPGYRRGIYDRVAHALVYRVEEQGFSGRSMEK